MKRIILLSFVSMLLSVGTTMAEGISSARELVAFATAANAGEDITPWADREGVISLTADIDMAKVKDFVPIAVFDGILTAAATRSPTGKRRQGFSISFRKRPSYGTLRSTPRVR